MAVKSEQRQVDCGWGSISYSLTRKQVKHINIRIKPDGRVLVSAAPGVPSERIDGLIRQKQAYIRAALVEFERRQMAANPVPRQYVSGERYKLLGNCLQLKVKECGEERVYTDGGYLVLLVRDHKDLHRKERLLAQWLNGYQRAVFQEILQETYASLQRYGIPFPELKIRTMTSRWGSCRPQKNSITLNSRLIETPRACIAYVVLHELVHFLHPNHSRQFWDFVEQRMPDWQEWKEVLDKWQI